jgi:hypothetical protein
MWIRLEWIIVVVEKGVFQGPGKNDRVGRACLLQRVIMALSYGLEMSRIQFPEVGIFVAEVEFHGPHDTGRSTAVRVSIA